MEDSTAEVAKALFGRPLRVVLARWILDRSGEPFFQQEAQDAMRLERESPSAVRKELRCFVDHRLLTDYLEGRRTYYRAVESPLWAAFAAIAEALDAIEHRTISARPPGPG